MFKLKFAIVFLILVLGIKQTYGQHSDCNTALFFEDSIGELIAPKVYGKKQEIKGYSIKNEYFFTREHNTVWCVIAFTQDANFRFELKPQLPNDDFDFTIIKYYGESTCDSIQNKLCTPIRSNLSKRAPEQGSITGLKKGYDNNYAAAGPNPSFSAPLDVKKGDSILIIIDSPYGSKGGFSVKNNSDYYPEIIPEEIAEPVIPETKRVTMVIQDEQGNVIPDPSIYIKSLGKIHRDNKQIDENGNVYSEFFKPNVEQLVIASQQGYLYQKFNFSWDGENDSTVYLQLTPLLPGTKLQLENILFLANSSQIATKSKDELEDLLVFLKNNPTMELEIGGHVHGPGKRNKKKYKKLSEERASAIYMYAISNGIDASKLTYKGYGNSEMIYKQAKNESQISANRRVEFTITKVK